MKISVVICAYTERRWDDVLAAVASVRAQRLAPEEVVLVVDHNEALLDRLRAALPDVRVLPNAGSQGLSGGKNTGVAAARGDVVAFLDDDAVAHTDWLSMLAAGYAEPHVAGVGGRTLPLWSSDAPRWFPEEFAWVVGCTYRGMAAGPIRNLMGGNASFRRAAFEVAGGFRSGIGRAPGKRPLGCEETEFCIRLRQAAPETVLLFDDRAVIWHRVPGERARFAYFRTRCYAEGLSKAMVTRSVGVGDGLASERRHALVELPRGVGRGLRAALTGDPAGLGRAGAIVAGLACTMSGYAAGSSGFPGTPPAPFGGPMGDAPPPPVPILMYHSIGGSDRLAVRPEAFADQLAHLRDDGFTPITFGELAAGVAAPGRPVVITFDDGYADFHERALPLLDKFGFRATVFVTTGWIRDAGRYAAGRPLGPTLSWSQVAEIAGCGIEIGGHGHSHAQLDQLRDAVLRTELLRSRRLLEDRVGRAVTTMAYPYGYSSARVRREVRAAGYAAACAVANALAPGDGDRLAVPRVTVRAGTTPAGFERALRGRGFLADHALTKGYAVVRRSRYAVRRLRGDA